MIDDSSYVIRCEGWEERLEVMVGLALTCLTCRQFLCITQNMNTHDRDMNHDMTVLYMNLYINLVYCSLTQVE